MKVKIRVVPRAKKEKIVEENGILKVYVNEPAIDGRANKKLIEVLADYYQTRKYNITILQGETQRDKVIEISG